MNNQFWMIGWILFLDESRNVRSSCCWLQQTTRALLLSLFCRRTYCSLSLCVWHCFTIFGIIVTHRGRRPFSTCVIPTYISCCCFLYHLILQTTKHTILIEDGDGNNNNKQHTTTNNNNIQQQTTSAISAATAPPSCVKRQLLFPAAEEEEVEKRRKRLIRSCFSSSCPRIE